MIFSLFPGALPLAIWISPRWGCFYFFHCLKALPLALSISPHWGLYCRGERSRYLTVTDGVQVVECDRSLDFAGSLDMKCRLLVVVREITREQEREHVIAEMVRVYRLAQLVGNVLEGFAKLLLVGFSHIVFSFVVFA